MKLAIFPLWGAVLLALAVIGAGCTTEPPPEQVEPSTNTAPPPSSPTSAAEPTKEATGKPKEESTEVADLVNRLKGDAKRLDPEANPEEFKAGLQETARAFFAALQEKGDAAAFLLTDEQVGLLYQESIARILITGRTGSNSLTIDNLKSLSSSDPFRIERVEVGEPNWRPANSKSGPLADSAHVIGETTLEIEIGSDRRLLILKNCFLTTEGWRFLQVELE